MSNSSVKIVRFHQTGGPEVLKLEEMSLPEPGKGEVRLRVHAIGLNRAEVMFRSGAYLVEPHFPSKIGYEASGVVEAVGPDVDKKMIGKTFSTVPCFDLGKYGVYGEVAIVPAYALAEYPERFSYVEGTSIWMQYLTAYGALIHYGKLAKNDFVLITAASSSVGLASIQIARAQGATSIVTTRTSKKKAELLSLGADHVIITNEENLPARVNEITKGKGVNIVFDPIAGKGVETLAETLAPGGILFVYGNLSMEPITPFPLFTALKKGISVRGYTLFEISTQPEVRAKGEKYIFEKLQNNLFKPQIARTFSLGQIVDAHKYMESNEQIGKIVVTP
ncbi:zinc-dependent alcohol dehydrogenase family protein [Legionella anisa]|uniref:NADPH:quinone reductase n=1 Tax=Legionella anisa TaxID=28082 RepID=A0AAX0WS93_9GAMM|nr:zinc-dependent alcohol dehydrogenase family protein [Legionella anisa]AWN74597.1 NADPH:quinone reductase [Legionella anisa]KTC71609.1 quinone oxidoreductase [Legionella anisa]MBN5937544.1 zinc-dependent alcohol dehydrogenase family protein [Legionella anisa]MCW8425289.1 zinc-dependent alcohol dehydrogenase family protein [Legionella anisa]MCW8449282.1 zinc-dependent alcohol dehydrogenase family protein [Legionella anisa]